MTEVRKHQRRTASGKMTTVRHHSRDAADGSAERDDWTDRAAASPPSAVPRVGSDELSALSQPSAQREDWWDEDEAPAGDWWDSAESQHGSYEVEHEGHTFKVNSAAVPPAESATHKWPEAAVSAPRKRTRAERKAAVTRYKAAMDALRANAEAEEAAGIDYETDRFHELNHAAHEAGKGVPWWRKW